MLGNGVVLSPRVSVWGFEVQFKDLACLGL